MPVARRSSGPLPRPPTQRQGQLTLDRRLDRPAHRHPHHLAQPVDRHH
ncbi:MAG: hypothetical protein U0974_09330 [Gemmatimonadales bacterium]|nr:hypothetical protein [Gemmatimonadales bacterium]MDZ4389919.1 hypothetical protein [Gemmatimonadales bacterium]